MSAMNRNGRAMVAAVPWAVLLASFLAAQSAATAQAPPAAPAATASGDGAVAGAPEEAGTGESQQDELSRRASDPTSSPPSLALINDLTFDYQDLPNGAPIDETGYELRLQSVVPFKAWGVANIFRMTVPYQIQGPGPTGVGDITIFDMAVLPLKRGRFGIGMVGSFASRASATEAHAVGGPAVVLIVPMSRKLNVGLFSQNLFGDDVSISQLQPIFAYQLGSGWSLSLGDLQFPYDWDRGEFLSLPVGVQLGKVQPIAGQPMRFSINPQYDFKGQPGAGRFSAIFTIQLMLPEKMK